MTIHITGNLIRPIDGLPVANATIEFVAAEGSLTVLEHSRAYAQTDANGFYSLELQYGHYTIWVKEDATLQELGYCIVNESSPSLMTLQELIKYTQPIPVDQVKQLDDKWSQELDELRNEYDTEIRQVKDQVVDGDAAVVTQMTTYTNERLGQEMAEMTKQVNAGDAQTLNQATAYADDMGNELASDITQLQTDNATLRAEMTAVTDANGSAIAQVRTDMEAGDAALEQRAKVYTDAETGAVEARVTQSLQAGDAQLSQDLQVVKDDLGNHQAHWQVEAQVEDLTSAIGMVNDGQTSEVYAVADKFTFTSTAGTEGVTPFQVVGDKVYAHELVLGVGSEVDYDKVKNGPPADATHGATQDQIDAIANAGNTADSAHTRIDTVDAEVASLDTRATQNALDIAAADGRIDDEEAARIAAISQEQADRASDVATLVAEDAALDGKITAEEAARIQASADLEAAYKEYNRVVTLAIADGVLTPEEQLLIASANAEVEAAKSRFESLESDTSSLKNDVASINTDLGNQALELANLDGKIDAEETARINAINAEEAARIADINARIAEDAALDGKITSEEAARIQQGNDLEVAYKNYSDTVAQALIDGEISDAEAAAIAEADRLVKEAEAALNASIEDTDNKLHDFIDVTYVNDKAEIEGQVDQKSETWFQLSTDPDPKDSWVTQADRDKHNRDTLYYSDSKQMYIYDSASHLWIKVEDQDAIDAMDSAVLAQATADGKVDTYYSPTEPANPKDGDLWVDTSEGDRMFFYDESLGQWLNVNQSTLIEQMDAATRAIANAVNAQATADGKIETYFQDEQPNTAHEGDIWFDTNDGNKQYVYQSGSWVIAQDQEIGKAIVAAAGAQATADGKVTTFYQNTTPTPEGIGDLWVDTDDGNKLYRWNGVAWDDVQDAAIKRAQDTADEVSANLATAVTDLQGRIDALSSQVDGQITSWFYETPPVMDAPPTSDWTTDAEKEIHLSDLYYDTVTGKAYRFTKVDGVYAWTEIPNSEAAQALAAAAAAQDTADQKRRVFLTTPTTPYDAGDLWSDGNDIKMSLVSRSKTDGYVSADWVMATNYKAELGKLNTTQSSQALEIAQLDGKITQEEADRIAAIAAEEAARAQDVSNLIAADAAMDGKITAEEQARIQQGEDLEAAYKAYSDTVAQALIDGEISQAEADAIAEAQRQIDIAEAALQGQIDSQQTAINQLNSDIANLEVGDADLALQIAAVDGKVDAEEAARIAAVAAEEAARISDINDRIAAEAALDGKITAEEQARIDQGTALETAYQNYTDTVAQALIDGEISDAEAAAIAEADRLVKEAEAALQADIDTNTGEIDTLKLGNAQLALDIAAVDGKVDAEEAARIAAIQAEEAARIQANNDRIATDALLDGKISSEEAARIQQGKDLEVAYENYTDTVAQALIDGEISEAEAAAIAEADRLVKEAEAALQQDIAAVDTKAGQNALEIAAVDGKIATEEAERINAINAEQQARIAQNNERIAAEAALDGKITDEEAARIQQGEDLEAAYKNYSDTVAQALIDGEISDAEAAAIAEAQRLVDEAETALQADIDKNKSDVDNFIDVIYKNDQTNLQSQIDGKVETWYVKSTDTDPKDSWTTDELKLAHNGDTKYVTDTRNLYYYDAGTHAWIKIEDQDTIDAMAAAQSAQETADGKIVTFYQDTVPQPEGVGDIWFDTDNDNEPKRWNGTQWVSARDSSVDQALADANAALIAANEAQAAADGKITVFYQETPPTGHQEGDMWYDIDNGNRCYYAQEDLSWVLIQDEGIAEAIDAAQTAQTTADGKAEVFYSDSEPQGAAEGDLWVNTANNMRIYRLHSSGVWESLNEIDVIEGSDKTLNAIADALKSAATADGKIVTFFEDEEPETAGEGDIWFDTNDGNKQYVYQSGEWVLAQDQEIGKAIEAAAGAQATADGKVTTFYQDEPPVAEGEGDLWVDTDNGNILYRWSGLVWQEVTDARVEESLARGAQAIIDAADAKALADSKIDVYYSDEPPTESQHGDIWVDTDNGNKQFRNENNTWVSIQDEAITEALNSAAKAQATADGKATIYYQATAPNSSQTQDGDIWIDSDDGNRQYTMKNDVWVDTSDARMDDALAEAAKAINAAADADAKADGKVDIFYMSSDPYQYAKEGDIWYDTGDKNKSYRRNGNAWRSIQDEDINAALEAASQAQATADGKTTTWYQDTAPSFSVAREGDTWFDTSEEKAPMYLAVDSGLSGLQWTLMQMGDETDYDDDRISNEKLTKDQVIQSGIYPNQDNLSISSANYSVGSAGWAIDNAGNAELNNATVRGTVYARAGKFEGELAVGGNFTVNNSGHLTARSIDLGGTSSSRMRITSDRLEVYDGNRLRVRIGRL